MLPAPLLIPCLIVAVALIASFFAVRRLCRLSRLPVTRFRRVVERVVLSLVTLVALGAAAGTTFNVVAHDSFLAHHPAPGQIYVVNGYKMHLWCMGQGSPTIVLESGLGYDSLVWGTVQPELSKTTRICSYDRAGTGWSGPQPGPRDSDHIVAQLHALLQQAGITGPIVLMGHSVAGIHMRAYVTRYPENVKGIVFVDGSTPLQQEHGSPELQAAMSSIPWSDFALYAVAVNVGALRVAGMFSKPSSDPGWGVGTLQAEDEGNPPIMTDLHELLSFIPDGRETIHTGPYGDLPILIFSQDTHSTEQNSGLSPKLAAELSSEWNQMQEDLKQLSTRSRRIIAKGSGHFIQLNRTDLVLKEVPIFIEQVRGNAPPPQYGTTTTE